MSLILHALDGSPLVGVLSLAALTGPVLMRQLLLFIGLKRALRGTRNDAARVSLFTAFSAALAPRRLPGESSPTDAGPSERNTPSP
jgi:hypothetical protein